MTTHKIPSLDGLRAISILLVVTSHVLRSDPVWKLKYEVIRDYGTTGVTIFFVISGFLITTLLLNEKFAGNGQINIQKFYIRRALRIIPVSFLYIAVIFLLNKFLALGIGTGAFLCALSYTANFFMLPGILGHLWSLSVEEQFYLCWPWLMRLNLRHIIAAAAIIIIYAPLVRVINYFFPSLEIITLKPFFKHADALMIGCLLSISQYAWPHLWHSSLVRSRQIKAAAIFLICLMPLIDNIKGIHVGCLTTPFATTITSLSIACVIANAITVRDSLTFRSLNHPVMIYIGTLSYSIYIWQQFFLVPGITYLPGWAQTFPVNILLIALTSMASYHLWERSFLNLKEKFHAN